jgi:CheY-like chemotaxis protein
MSPLAAIVGYAELLRTRDDEAIRTAAPAAILEAAERLKQAVYALVYRDEVGEVSDRRQRDHDADPELRPPASAHHRVVIVDDEPLVRSLLRITLPGDAFDVLEASDGEAAVRLIADNSPSLVVLDWQLPGRTGADVLEEVKRRFPELPIVVLTASRDPSERSRAEELGANMFLTKPFSPLELLEVIERLLGDNARNA